MCGFFYASGIPPAPEDSPEPKKKKSDGCPKCGQGWSLHFQDDNSHQILCPPPFAHHDFRGEDKEHCINCGVHVLHAHKSPCVQPKQHIFKNPKDVAEVLCERILPVAGLLLEKGADLGVVVTCIVNAGCALAFEKTKSKLQARDMLYKAVQDSLVVMEFKEKETKG